ncbi:hypothetical protein AYK20_05455 [Thermoplasmatales archaeon SG8-52-1]|nr:MAG: hypothetical protein AYK20_05455 [Thermoplasmatales archaeon SG8-52-1]
MKIKNRHRLKSKDIKIFQNELKNIFEPFFIDEKALVEKGDLDGIKIILVDGKPCFMYYEKKIFFTLTGINKYSPKKKFVIVDMGAVKFVTSGADVMAPGIIDADESIDKNDQVWICDENHHKPLAVGIAIMTGEQMKKD